MVASQGPCGGVWRKKHQKHEESTQEGLNPRHLDELGEAGERMSNPRVVEAGKASGGAERWAERGGRGGEGRARDLQSSAGGGWSASGERKLGEYGVVLMMVAMERGTARHGRGASRGHSSEALGPAGK